MPTKVSLHIQENISYNDAWEWQKEKFRERVEAKKNGIKMPMVCMLCTHKTVYTLGKSADKNNFLHNRQWFQEKGIEIFDIERGGDITYHGPGQWVLYPIFDLDQLNLGVKDYVFNLEESIIKTIASFNLKAKRIKDYTGVWMGDNPSNERKIAAIGIKVSRYISMHGFALNINTDLKYFNYIVPCGIQGKDVTTLSQELKLPIDMENVKNILLKQLESIFNIKFVTNEYKTK